MSLSGEPERGGLERGELERELVGPQLVGPQLEREPRGEADSEAVRELRSAGIDVWMAGIPQQNSGSSVTDCFDWLTALVH